MLVIIKSPGLQTFINCVGGRGVCFCSAPVESCRHLIEDFFFSKHTMMAHSCETLV